MFYINSASVWSYITLFSNYIKYYYKCVCEKKILINFEHTFLICPVGELST